MAASSLYPYKVVIIKDIFSINNGLFNYMMKQKYELRTEYLTTLANKKTRHNLSLLNAIDWQMAYVVKKDEQRLKENIFKKIKILKKYYSWEELLSKPSREQGISDVKEELEKYLSNLYKKRMMAKSVERTIKLDPLDWAYSRRLASCVGFAAFVDLGILKDDWFYQNVIVEFKIKNTEKSLNDVLDEVVSKQQNTEILDSVAQKEYQNISIRSKVL